MRGTVAERHARTRSEPGVALLGLGAFVPDRVLTNADLSDMVDTSDDWIVTRTGIRERHIVGPGEATSDLAIEAGRRALDAAGMDPGSVELILLATATPDQLSPSTTSHVHRGLGAVRAAGFDLNAACSGFLHALLTAHHLVAGGAFANALVIGADTLSSITDYEDRGTCVLFGDGAGAFVLGAKHGGAHGATELIDHMVGMDGTGAHLIEVAAGGSRTPASHDTIDRRDHYLRLDGRRVFRFAVSKIVELVETMAERNGLALDDIDLVVPHQANHRILDAARQSLGFDADRFFANIDMYGNTSNASIPLALDEALTSGRLRRGANVLLVTFGGGLTWGASLLRW